MTLLLVSAAYFTRGDYNIFVVDYQTLVRLPCLSQIQWSPSFLALCVSQVNNNNNNTLCLLLAFYMLCAMTQIGSNSL